MGDLLAGRYEIRALLGRGGMGEVYEAVDRRLERTVAVKVLRPELAADRQFLTRFRREARTAARLSHPGIVVVHDIGKDRERAFIVMEFVPGLTLAQILSEEGPLHPSRAASIGADAAEALAHAHERGVVHRDVTPSNIMITPSDEVKVLDFGIARAARSSSRSGSPSVHGTLAYVAPEQARGDATDQRVDVYALGAVLHELLGDPEDDSSDLGRVLRRCLAARPEERFLRADHLAVALHRAEPQSASLQLQRSASSAPPTAPIVRPITAVLPEPGLGLGDRRIAQRLPRRRRGRASVVAAMTVTALGAAWIAIPALSSMGGTIMPKVRGPRPVPAPSAVTAQTSCSGWLSTRADLAWTPGGPSEGYEIWRRQGGGGSYELVTRIDDWQSTPSPNRDSAWIAPTDMWFGPCRVPA